VNQYVAVSTESLLTGIKRHLLLFDRVAVLQSEQDWSFRENDASLAADLDWLEERGLLFRVSDFLNQELGWQSVDTTSGIAIELVDVPNGDPIKAREARLGRRFARRFNHKTVKNILEGLEDWGCRWEAQRLTRSVGVQAVSLVPPRTEVDPLVGADKRRGHVLRVVLNQMPEPSDQTSLEEILQFRQDPESNKRMLDFRRWIHNLVTRGFGELEITEELEWLTQRYEEHMRLHGLRVNTGIVELTITTAAEIAEDLLKIRWGKLSKMLFSATRRKIDLLEAEMNAPGREIAYVVRAQKTFDT
jgi:hypothetical protein